MNTALLIGGIALIAVTITDFVFTTLSCNGSGYLSTGLNRILGKILVPRSDGMRNWTGVLHLVAALLMWVCLLILGGFLIFASDTDLVIHSATKIPADWSERAYYTAFVFSTLGIGDYVPGSDLSRQLTAVYSVLGFAVLTTAITYILSVTGAVAKKKNLATFIAAMGETPSELFAYFTTRPDGSVFTERIDDLVAQLNTHLNDHLGYPIVHYFHSDRRAWSAIIQLASLNECLLALRIHYRDSAEVLAHLRRLERSLEYFLQLAQISDKLRREEEGALADLRRKWRVETLGDRGGSIKISDNSQSLGALLRQAGYDWQDVFRKG